MNDDAPIVQDVPPPGDVRHHFHDQLDALRGDVVRLGRDTVDMIPMATRALLAGDLRVAAATVEADDAIDAATVSIEHHCYDLLATQGPMASDLRRIVAVLKMTADIERSADLCVNIARAARRLSGREMDPAVDIVIQAMSERSIEIFSITLDAYDRTDAELATTVDRLDDALDDLHRELIRAILASHNEGRIDAQVAVQLALVARFFERLGDHAVNVADRVMFIAGR